MKSMSQIYAGTSRRLGKRGLVTGHAFVQALFIRAVARSLLFLRRFTERILRIGYLRRNACPQSADSVRAAMPFTRISRALMNNFVSGLK
jgi:hypothetical protein